MRGAAKGLLLLEGALPVRGMLDAVMAEVVRVTGAAGAGEEV